MILMLSWHKYSILHGLGRLLSSFLQLVAVVVVVHRIGSFFAVITSIVGITTEGNTIVVIDLHRPSHLFCLDASAAMLLWRQWVATVC